MCAFLEDVMAHGTLNQMFQTTVNTSGPRTAQVARAGDSWTRTSYAQYGHAVKEASLGLQGLGIEPGERVSILATNSPSWAVADMAILHAGAVCVPIYDTLLPEQVAFILNDCEVKAIFVGDEGFLETIQAIRSKVPSLEHVLSLPELDDAPEDVRSLARLRVEGANVAESDPDAFEQRWRAVQPDDLATLIYTSGTTGDPKGVMLSHDNIASNIQTSVSLIDIGPDDVYLSFLPLSHSFERIVGHFAMTSVGVEVWYARSVDTLLDDLKECRPTVFVSIPRLYEKMYTTIMTRVADASPARRRLFAWAMDQGSAVFEHRAANTRPPLAVRLRHAVADRLVLSKVREGLGFDRTRFMASGAAALSDEVARFFGAIDVLLLEGYGLTEASPVISVNLPERFKVGTVGPPIPGVEVRIDTDAWEGREGEGEILARGPNIMKGYWNRPEETAEALTQDGWLRTGDVGLLDEDGFLVMTDRKKELFKTSYGKYIAPQRIEGLLALQPHVGLAVAIGAERKYVAALIQPDLESLEAWAKKEGLAWRDREDLVALDEVRALFQRNVDTVNEELARYEQVKSFALVPRAFEVGRELTPTLKVKRRVVEEEYAGLIRSLYPEG